MPHDFEFNQKMQRTHFGRAAGAHNDSFAPRISNLPHDAFESKWDRLGDKILVWGSVLGLAVLAIALWRNWL